ncbi:hypothetical protein PVAND_015983 [Polypedilum vanderplanki]|uniref:Uncharacterized protein n=1 Tax=Polypedilum vanderplanki TaxID=319348 RepID=A0A9J6BEA0_POLVA|nr:hypothetical protein PVAND_015983 [Polypedilum vanderplanki]
MFEFMTSDMRKPLPESLDDLRALNYTIVIQDSFFFISTAVLQEMLNGRESPKVMTVLNDNNIYDAEFLVFYNQSTKEKTNTKFAFLIEANENSVIDNFLNQSLPIMQNEKISKSSGYFMPKNHMLLLHM